MPCRLQTAVYVSLIAACSYAWSTSTGYAPTGRQIIDGVIDDIRALFKNSSWLSGALSLLSVFAAGAGILTLAEPFQYFEPEAFRCEQILSLARRKQDQVRCIGMEAASSGTDRSQCDMQGAEWRAGRMVHAHVQHQSAIHCCCGHNPEVEGPC